MERVPHGENERRGTMRLKGLWIGLAAVAAASCLAACSGGSSVTKTGDTTAASGTKETAKTDGPKGEESTKKTMDSESGGETAIKFGIHVADPEHQESVTYKIVEAFNEKYKGKYRVEFEAAEKSAHDTSLKLKAADGTLPEIFWMDSAAGPEYAEAGYLLDLSGFLSQYPEVDKALDTSVKEAFQDKIQYGLPYQCNVEGFFYNKEAFKKAGVQEPVNGTTYEELLEMIPKFQAAGITPVAQGSTDAYAVWGFLAAMDRYGYSDYIHDILDGKEMFSNENMIKFFEKLEELGKKGAFPSNMSTLSYFDAKTNFEAGTAAMLNTGAWDCAELDEKMGDQIGFWWGPVFSDSSFEQNRAMKVPSAPICVSAKVAEDEKIEKAVYTFLEFYYSKDAAKISYEGSVFPATNYTGIEAADGQYALKAVMNAMKDNWESPAVQPDQILSSAVQTQLYDSMLGVMLGNYTPTEALDKLDKQLSYE